MEEKKRTSFLNNIEKHYQNLVTFHKSSDFKQASNELRLFRKYGKLDYKNVADISRQIISALEQKVKKLPASMAQKNLEIYKQLLALDPMNPRYKQKVAHYTQLTKKIAEAKARKRGEKEAEPKKRVAKDIGWHVTKSGYVAAATEELLDRAINLAVSGDTAAFNSFVSSNPLVFPLKGGITVYLEKLTWGGKARIRPKGSAVSIWTVMEAIE